MRNTKFINLIQQIYSLDFSLMNSFEENKLTNEIRKYKPNIIAYNKVIPFLERLTINKNIINDNTKSIEKLKDLKYRPLDKLEKITNYGRANLKYQSVFYASINTPTPILETNPQEGDLVTISKWIVIDDNIPLLVCPIVDYPNEKDFQLLFEFESILKEEISELQEMIVEDSLYLSKCFSKYVEKGKDLNYIFSANIADMIFNEYNNGGIEAIIYPSVQDTTKSNNIALKPDVLESKYRIYEIDECVVEVKNNHSIFLRKIKKTNKISDQGVIIW